MNIINHGSWVLYTPDGHPDYAPKQAIFSKRTSDDQDWYEYIYTNGAPRAADAPHPFAPNSIKLTVADDTYLQGTVLAATRDETMLFPQRMTLLEITDDPTDDPMDAYKGFVYDPVANTLTAPAAPPVPPQPTNAELMAQLQAIAAALGVTIS
ncbi:hypothetical protein [Tardiphaga sp. 367_B4_N1_1]|uniref:hypothetical protein n=1 Tax=Tardiphaga sp. 367_B4_N1_1 TaxID=3240777 RepID=UPI003F25ACC0